MANARFPEFVRSTEYRRELGLKRKRAIKKMYSDIAKETENKINAIQRAGKWTGTTVLQMKQLRDLQKSIDDSLKNISAQIEKDIVSDMKKVAEVTCADVAGMMKRIGVNVGAAYAHVPELAVKNIVSGNLYGQRWNFSKAVWGDYRKASGDLAQIVAKGLAQNRPIYDIAKDLEKYVNPNVRKDFDWSKRYPGSKKKVDYNAYRLAQTMSTHAHQQAVILSCKDDPLIDGVEWRSSGGVNVCPLCEQRNGEVFPLDKCPMDHPMGACILVPHFKGTKIDEKTGKLIEPDFHSEAAKVDGDELRKEFEAEKARLRAEREAKKATTVNNAASSNNTAEKLSQLQKASDELGKAVKDFGKSVDGFEKAMDNLQNAAKGLTSSGNGGIMSLKRSISIPNDCTYLLNASTNFENKDISIDVLRAINDRIAYQLNQKNDFIFDEIKVASFNNDEKSVFITNLESRGPLKKTQLYLNKKFFIGGNKENIDAMCKMYYESGWWKSQTLEDLVNHEIMHARIIYYNSYEKVERLYQTLSEDPRVHGFCRLVDKDPGEFMNEMYVAINNKEKIEQKFIDVYNEYLAEFLGG